MYILKIKGKARIPDYVQLRDEDFNLKAYFRVDRPEKGLARCGLANKEMEIKAIIEKLSYGKIEKLVI